MNKLDFFSALFGLSFAVYVSIESLRLGLGTWHIPGPGYFSFAGSLLLGVNALLVSFRALGRFASDQAGERKTTSEIQNVIKVLVGMAAYISLLKVLGTGLCTFLLVAFFQRWIAKEGWLRTVAVGFLVSLGVHVVFNVLLNAQLPRGPLGF